MPAQKANDRRRQMFSGGRRHRRCGTINASMDLTMPSFVSVRCFAGNRLRLVAFHLIGRNCSVRIDGRRRALRVKANRELTVSIVRMTALGGLTDLKKEPVMLRDHEGGRT